MRFRRIRGAQPVFLLLAHPQATPQEAVDPCSVVNLYLTHHVVDTLSGPDQCYHAFSLSC